MDPRRFDALARSLAAPRSRRGFLAGLGALLLGARAAGAQTACPPGQTANRKGDCSCPPGTDACPTGCFDRARDPANCGACGRSCAGGQCVKGGCRCPSGLVADPVLGCVAPATTTTAPPATTVAPTTTTTTAAPNTTTTTSTPVPGTCGPLGAACAGEEDCCQDVDFTVCDGACCRPVGGACAGGGDCCSGACREGFCCAPPRSACGDDGECCAPGLGVCGQGVCRCMGVGEACAGTSECCDGSTCQEGTCRPGFCLGLQEQCGGDFDCCGATSVCRQSCGTVPFCCEPSGRTCAADCDCCGGQGTCAGGRCCQAEGGACNSSLPSTGCCAGLTCTGVDGTCQLVCLGQTRKCGVGCCPLGQECCNGACCGASQDCRNFVCRDCLGVRAACDPVDNQCCQDVATSCMENGLVSTVGRECCRPLGGACERAHDANGKGDCCSNSYAFTGTIYAGPCGFEGICGGEGGVCSVDNQCVSGSCRGHCDNQFPVRECITHEECDCEGDIEDGCVREVGFCIDKRCQG